MCTISFSFSIYVFPSSVTENFTTRFPFHFLEKSNSFSSFFITFFLNETCVLFQSTFYELLMQSINRSYALVLQLHLKMKTLILIYCECVIGKNHIQMSLTFLKKFTVNEFSIPFFPQNYKNSMIDYVLKY